MRGDDVHNGDVSEEIDGVKEPSLGDLPHGSSIEPERIVGGGVVEVGGNHVEQQTQIRHVRIRSNPLVHRPDFAHSHENRDRKRTLPVLFDLLEVLQAVHSARQPSSPRVRRVRHIREVRLRRIGKRWI